MLWIEKGGGASRWRRSKTQRSPSSPKIHQKYIYMWNNSYRTPTECWQKPQASKKARNSPHNWVGQKKKEEKETKDLHLWEGAVKEEKFPHARKSPHWWRWEGGEPQRWGQQRGCGGKAERILHRGSVPTRTHQSEMLVGSPARAGGGWVLRLGFWKSDPRERTGVGCMKTAWGV